jgi:hypothetical protein
MQFGPELEQLFLLVVGELQRTPAEDEALQDVARALGDDSPGSSSITRAPNCVTVTDMYKESFPVIERVCGDVGLRCRAWDGELRIFPM